MLVSNALIGLREGLEAALVVVILVAFLVRTDRRWALRHVWAGVAAAVTLSVGIGGLLTYGTRQLSFASQELIGGTASIVAVAFVTAMVFWMRTAARTISGELKGRLDRALSVGGWAVALVGFLGVGREGLETALFFYASVQTAGAGTAQPLVGFVVGLAVAVALGVLIYRGAVRINLSLFFRWTGIALIVVAAGILSYGLHDLQEAAFLPGLDALAFDVSGAVPPDSWYGVLLKGTVNFTPDTTWLQAVAWTVYTATVLILFLRPQRSAAPAMRTPTLTVALMAVVLATSVACSSGDAGTSGSADGSGPISVEATDTTCTVGRTEAAAGTIEFTVRNKGSKVNEFYVYGEGDQVLGEVENITPGLTRTVHIEVTAPGTYETACKPGMKGSGIRGDFTVTGATSTKAPDAAMTAAVADYQTFVSSQADELLVRTTEFVDLVKAGKVEQAKEAYPVARGPWERIEPVAESFGDLDPMIDGREDVVEEGKEFTGFHRLEKDLWVDGLQSDSSAIADRLLVDVTQIVSKAKAVTLNPLQLANGSKALLDEVATGKITGEEDRYSHTDLYDLDENVKGSKAAIDALRPVLKARDAALLTTIDARFARLDEALDAHRTETGFEAYTALSTAEVKALAVALDAVSEPISKVAAVVAGR